MQGLRGEYARQGSFVYVENFLPAEITARLIESVAAVRNAVNRNYLPAHKQGGSVSRHTIDAQAPVIAELYRSAALRRWLDDLTGERLQLSPPKIHMLMRCIFIRVPAITSAGITTLLITQAGATPYCWA